jgi:hypothetical protein
MTKLEPHTSPDERDSFYECPACGENVSNDDLDAMRLHHAHVLNPPVVDQTAAALQARLEFDRAQMELHGQKQSAFGETPRLVTIRR